MSQETRDYVHASIQGRARRHRAQFAVAILAAIVLVTGSGIALGQRQTSLAAAASARKKAKIAESARLAGLATTLIGVDPDLPWILASKAIQTKQTPQAIAAARQVVQLVPAHKSIHLHGIPRSMSADPKSGLIAIRYVDGSTDVRSGIDGRLKRRWPATTADGRLGVAIAPGGAKLLIGSRFVEVPSGKPIRTLDGTFAGWKDASDALIVKNGHLGVEAMNNGNWKPMAVTVKHPQDLAWSIASAAPIASLLDGDRVLSIDLRTGRSLPPVRVPVKSRADIATSPDGSMVYVALQAGSKGFERTGAKLKPMDVSGAGGMVVATRKTWLVQSGEDPVNQIDQRTGNSLARYLAHRGPVLGIGALPGGRTATIGADRYLRLWAAPPAVRYPAETAMLTFDSFAMMPPRIRTLNRPHLVLSTDGTSLIETDPNHGLATVFNTTTLNVQSQAFVGIAPDMLLPTAEGQVLTLNGSMRLDVVRIASRKATWSTNALSQRTKSGTVVAAIDGSGAEVVVADSTKMVLVTSQGSVTDIAYKTTGTPAWVGLDDEGSPMVVTTVGNLFRNSGIPIRLPDLGAPIAGAGLGPHGGLFLVTIDGTLARWSRGHARIISHLSGNIEPFAIKVASDGSTVAVIGNKSSALVNAKHGVIVTDLHPQAPTSAVIRDVAIRGDRIWEVRADGGVLSSVLTTSAQLAVQLRQSSPRTETTTEIAALKSVASTVGGD